jgi:hypothetical protein
MKPFRLKCKVFERHAKGEVRQFMAPTVTLNLDEGTATAFCMSDELTISQEMTIAEWNALPYCYFETDGTEAPRPAAKVLPSDWDRNGRFTKGRS